MARTLAFALLAAVAAAQNAAPQQPLQPAERKPIMVASLNGAKPNAQPPAKAPLKGFAHHAGDHGHEMRRLEKSIEDHQQTLESLQKQLEDGLKQKQRLLLAQKLMTAIIALKKAERVLTEIDTRVATAKDNIRKFGEQADEITESIKRSEIEHRREVADMNKKLEELRKSLKDQEHVLTDLSGKRGRVQETVKRWKDHVATLRDAHEAAARIEGVPASPRIRDALEVPEPPPAFNVLGDLGILPGRFPREVPPSAQLPAVDAIIAIGQKSIPMPLAEAAAREVAKRTFAELGQSRFASEPEDEAHASSAAQAQLEDHLMRFLARDDTDERIASLNQLLAAHEDDTTDNAAAAALPASNLRGAARAKEEEEE